MSKQFASKQNSKNTSYPSAAEVSAETRYFSRAMARIARSTMLPAILGVLVFMLFAVGANASEGVFLLGNDALQLGRASSGIASPRSAYWSYLNPASIVDLDRRIDTNLYTVFTDIEAKPRGLIGNQIDGDLSSDGIFEIVSGGMIWPLGKYGTIGGGVYIPSGTGVEYQHSRNLLSRLIGGNSDRKLNYQHFRLVLSYAYRFENGWAVGVGLHSSVSRFRSDHITLAFRTAEADNDWDEALGAGFGLGIYKAWEKWSVGFAYESRHWTQHMSKYEDLLAHPLDTPHIYQAGVGYKITPDIQVTADIKYLNWEEVSAYGSPMEEGGFNWRDQIGIKFGAEWKVNDRWTLMCGYAHSNSPVQKDHVLLSTLVPVVVEDHLAAGVAFNINAHHEINLAFIHAFKHTERDSGRGDLFSRFGKGSELSASAESLVIGYTYRFGPSSRSDSEDSTQADKASKPSA